jgi:hypothetical protein
MRCMSCGTDMTLMKVVQEETITVPGFEHHTFMCSLCGDVERRLIFTKHGRESDTVPETVHSAPPIVPTSTVQDERFAAPGLLKRVVAKIRGR